MIKRLLLISIFALMCANQAIAGVSAEKAEQLGGEKIDPDWCGKSRY